ncbi:helix-turn-helix domain-containing protein [Actinoplanes sandaracinus]|uniref:helix-turn-helix domain-containing protein n=1 Tax=Actinoplanes sandaracinus TaxID=3045177 RepID=UPI003898D62E
MQAAELFEQNVPAAQVAARLRVSAKSAYAWKKQWRARGRAGLTSKAPPAASAGWIRFGCSDCRTPSMPDRPRTAGLRINAGPLPG